MIWFWLAIGVAVIWSITNLIDKHIVTDLIKEPLAILMLVPIFTLSFSVVLYFVNTAPISEMLLFPFLLGLLNTVGYLAYYKAMKVEEASRVLSLTYTLPIFVLIYATVFLRESLSLLQYSGIFLIAIGAVAIGLRRVEKVFRASPAVVLAIGSAVLWAGIDTGLKWSIGNIPLLQSVMAIFLGYGVSSALFWALKRNRKVFFKNVKFGKPILVLAMSGRLRVRD